MKVIINGWPLLSPHTGIGSYVRNLGSAIQSDSSMDTYFFYGSYSSQEIRTDSLPGISKVKSLVKKYIPKPYDLMRAFQQFHFNKATASKGFDLYHEPSFMPLNFKGPTVVTVHDLSPMYFPETHPKDRVKDFITHLPDSLRVADRILVDSDFIRNEIINEFGFSHKIDTVHLGVDSTFRVRTEDDTHETLSSFGLRYKKYILAVGTIEPRKNLLSAIKSYQKLTYSMRQEYALVIIGMRGWENGFFDRELKGADLSNIIMPGFISQEKILHLYSGASLFIYPSLYEGFGLPVLEAMASGVPVITSNCASLPEVSGDTGILLDPYDIDGMAENMTRCLSDSVFTTDLSARGIMRASQFTWEKCAKKTIATYQKAIGH